MIFFFLNFVSRCFDGFVVVSDGVLVYAACNNVVQIPILSFVVLLRWCVTPISHLWGFVNVCCLLVFLGWVFGV